MLTGIVLFEPVRRVLSYNTLDFGGKAGFYQDTVAHLVFNILHRTDLAPAAQLAGQILLTCVVLAPVIILTAMVIRRNKICFDDHLGLTVATLVFLLTCAVIILLHVIRGTDYPVDRFSIFLFPLFMVQLGFLFHYLLSLKFRKGTLAVLSVAAMLSLISFWQKADLYETLEWAYDSKTRQMIQTLSSHREMNLPGARDIKLSTHWHFEPTINFYRVTNQMNWLLPVARDGPDDSDDYLYLYRHELHQLDSAAYFVIQEYGQINTLLLVNKASITSK
jgi:hypothetical protein